MPKEERPRKRPRWRKWSSGRVWPMPSSSNRQFTKSPSPQNLRGMRRPRPPRTAGSREAVPEGRQRHPAGTMGSGPRAPPAMGSGPGAPPRHADGKRAKCPQPWEAPRNAKSSRGRMYKGHPFPGRGQCAPPVESMTTACGAASVETPPHGPFELVVLALGLFVSPRH